jgi:hypothetical protein
MQQSDGTAEAGAIALRRDFAAHTADIVIQMHHGL